MKKVLSLVLILCVALSVCFLTACSGNTSGGKVDPNKNIYEDFEEFDSYVPKDSDIIGVWTMTSPETNREWQFFANTTLHQTRIYDETRTSSVCTYNYDGEGNLKVYSFNINDELEYKVAIEGDQLVVTDEEGTVMKFTKNK